MLLLQKTSRAFRGRARAAAWLALAFTLAGCSKSGDKTPTGTGTDVGVPGISVAISTLTAAVATGSPATLGVTLVRSGNYTGTVALTTEGLPTGVTASFDPANLAGSSLSSVMTIAVGVGAVSSTGTITVRGTGTGVTSATATVQLTVGVAGITLASGVSAVTAPRNGSATLPLTITRLNSYAGSVVLTAEGLPQNVTATFTPALLPNGTTAATLTLGILPLATAPSSTPIVIRATGPGIADKTVQVQLNVSSP